MPIAQLEKSNNSTPSSIDRFYDKVNDKVVETSVTNSNRELDELEEIREIERKWQAKWRESRIFEANPDESKPKFFITVPYPYTSGPLHIGHGRTYTIGDIIARYKRMRGFNVLFPMAFHITGTPIASISDRIKLGDSKARAMYFSYIMRYEGDPKKADEILEKFVDPFEVAQYFASKIQIDFDALGFSIDWRRKFHTGEPLYNRFIEWQYHHLKNKGHLTRGSHKVTYCLLHQQPEGEDDIKDADVNPVDIVEFTAIKFRFEDGYIVAGTLRPETIFGATNLWVNPEATYVKFEWKGEKLYMSKEAVEKFEYQYGEVTRVSEYNGEYFIGKTAISPLGRELLILPAPFVDPDHATGFVYSEPSDAPYDYVALIELKRNESLLKKYQLDPEKVRSIEPIKIIEVPGVKDHHAKVIVEKMGIESQHEVEKLEEATKQVYKEQYYNAKMLDNTGEFAGMKVSEAKEAVKRKFLEENKAFLFYETSRKAECRAGGKIIIATIRDQWFLDYSNEEWKAKARDWINKMLIYPEKYRKLFLDTVDWLDKRPCARKRGLGTRLPWDPDWIIESLSDSTIYMAFYTIIHHLRQLQIDPDKVTPEFFDYVFLGKGDAKSLADKMGIPVEEIEKMHKEFEYWYPNDQRHTGIAHITNHLTFFIMHHIAIFPQEYWPRGITLNEMVIKDGTKMAKSKGNVVFLRDIAERYSADLFRMYATFAADLDGILDWREKDVVQMKRQLLRLYRYMSEAIASNDIKDWDRETPVKWFVSRFQRRLGRVTDLMDHFKFRDAIVELVFNTMSDISYLERRVGQDEAKKVVKLILDSWIRALAPIIPHIAEEIWSMLGKKEFISLTEWPKVDESKIDERAEAEEEAVRKLITDIQEVLKLLKEKPKTVKVFIASEWKRKLVSETRKLMEEGSSRLGDIMREIMKNENFRSRSKEVQKIIQRLTKDRNLIPTIDLTVEEEIKLYEQAKEFIERETGCEVVITLEDKVENEKERAKAALALPLKPGFFFS